MLRGTKTNNLTNQPANYKIQQPHAARLFSIDLYYLINYDLENPAASGLSKKKGDDRKGPGGEERGSRNLKHARFI